MKTMCTLFNLPLLLNLFVTTLLSLQDDRICQTRLMLVGNTLILVNCIH